jgi:type VI secretion system secreted protein Hcp
MAVDYFLKIDGIAGESTDAKHKEEIELVSFNWGVAQQSSGRAGSGGGAGKAQFKGFEFIMRVNKASPQLFLATVSGKHIKEANLSVRKAGKSQLEYLKIKFTDILVSSFNQAAGADQPEEMVAFNFAKIQIEYSAQSAKGSAAAGIKAGWDLKQNVKI